MTKSRDPYTSLRNDECSSTQIFMAFCEGSPITRYLWSVRELPGGSRVLLHGDNVVGLYDGSLDKFFFDPVFGGEFVTKKEVVASLAGFDVCISTSDLFEQYKKLAFLDRLRGGVD